jgi:hypothetical protein
MLFSELVLLAMGRNQKLESVYKAAILYEAIRISQ